jgi:hypothetical protein
MTVKYYLCMTEIRKSRSPMDFEAVALFTADHAAVENGKVYVNGGFWDTIFQPSYPAQVSVSLVAIIKVPSRAFLEDHRVIVEMVDADEERLPLKIEGSVRVGPTAHMNPGEPSILPLAFPLNGVSLERAGDYWFVLSVDGNEIARYRIRAVQSVPIPQPTDGKDAEEE